MVDDTGLATGVAACARRCASDRRVAEAAAKTEHSKKWRREMSISMIIGGV